MQAEWASKRPIQGRPFSAQHQLRYATHNTGRGCVTWQGEHPSPSKRHVILSSSHHLTSRRWSCMDT